MKRILIFDAMFVGVTQLARNPLPYPIVDTGQTRCYDDRHEIPPPPAGLTRAAGV